MDQEPKTRDRSCGNPRGEALPSMISMEDVTDRVLKGISDTMSAISKMQKMLTTISSIEKEARAQPKYETRVRSLSELTHSTFSLQKHSGIFVWSEHPQSVGKFGEKADNWIWPRHTGDFLCSGNLLRRWKSG